MKRGVRILQRSLDCRSGEACCEGEDTDPSNHVHVDIDNARQLNLFINPS